MGYAPLAMTGAPILVWALIGLGVLLTGWFTTAWSKSKQPLILMRDQIKRTINRLMFWRK